MNPALSIVVFTTLAGYAQGLVVALAVAVLAGAAPSDAFLRLALAVGECVLVAALLASFLHLGRKLRAWRAALMWRTSWMSREVIVLPALIASIFGWWWSLRTGGAAGAAWPLVVLLLSAALWYCTAMIYACLRFVQEWAHPLTAVNYTLIGLSSGLVLAGALASATGERGFAIAVAPWAFGATLAAAVTRAASLVRNRGLRPKSTLQSATGIAHPQLRQMAMGMSAGSFNTREFFHGRSAPAIRHVRFAFLLFGFAVPALLLALVSAGHAWLWPMVLASQLPGLLLERWFFFAEARHPQNLYYQRVS